MVEQMVSADSTVVSPEGEVSEVQRLVRRIQQAGVDVLSLSERMFLAHHSKPNRVTPPPGEGNTVQLLELQVEQDLIVVADLRRALDTETKAGLEMITKMSAERRLRSELEDELAQARKQLERGSRVTRSLVDSDNEEFLNTIQAQRVHIKSLEESLEKEKENFSQLQNVLQEYYLFSSQNSFTGLQSIDNIFHVWMDLFSAMYTTKYFCIILNRNIPIHIISMSLFSFTQNYGNRIFF